MHAHRLLPLARSPRPTTIEGVVDRLLAIEAALPEHHGVATFNRLYRWTTENVGRTVEAGGFESPDAVVELDVRFAGLYFDAVDAWARGDALPGAWAPLFEAGDEPDIAPIRFAVAGMHAHINRDLAVAIAECSRRCPEEDSAHFRDYCEIDRVLDRTSDQVRGRILTPRLLEVDTALGELDDRLVIAGISAARRGAWEASQLLWTVRERPTVWRTAIGFLDRAVGTTARILLFDPDLPEIGGYRAQLADHVTAV